jgi:ATP-dependent protease ClpP protease subunit
MTVEIAPGVRALQARARQQPKSQPWYRIENRGADSATVLLMAEIGDWGITAQQFAEEIAALDVRTINLRVNSPGGSVFDGVAIHNAIKNHPARVVATVDGLAASAASFIIMAADEVVVEPNATVMIHDASGLTVGDASDHREMADLLDKLSGTIAGMYAAKTGRSADEFRALMKAETWFNAEEAVACGLADVIAGQSEPEPEADAINGFDLSAFKYAGRDAAPAPKLPATQVEDIVRAGLTPEAALALVEAEETPQEPAEPPAEPEPTETPEAAPEAALEPVETPSRTDAAEAEPPATDEDTWGALVARLTSTTAPLDPVGDALASLREAMQ